MPPPLVTARGEELVWALRRGARDFLGLEDYVRAGGPVDVAFHGRARRVARELAAARWALVGSFLDKEAVGLVDKAHRAANRIAALKGTLPRSEIVYAVSVARVEIHRAARRIAEAVTQYALPI